MYLNFYGLKENPFSLTPDPKYLFQSKTHQEALSRMIYTVKEKRGFMLLTGEVGTGKTLLINAFMRHLPNHYQVVTLSHAILSPGSLIKGICKGFGIPWQNRPVDDLLYKLQDFLRWNYRAGKKSVLIIDEAQILEPEILEHIRLLSNFEYMNEKYIQIILVGQPEMRTKLKSDVLKPLSERLNLTYQLQPLEPQDIQKYIFHRLRIAGYGAGNHLFAPKIMEVICRYSQGIPRRINICCEKTMIIGYSKNLRYIG